MDIEISTDNERGEHISHFFIGVKRAKTHSLCAEDIILYFTREAEQRLYDDKGEYYKPINQEHKIFKNARITWAEVD